MNRTSLLLDQTREEVWRHVARELTGTWRSGDFWTPDTLTIPIPPWRLEIIVDTSTALTVTRLSAVYQPKLSGFRATIQRVGVFQPALLDHAQTLCLDPRFQRCYQTTSTNPELLREILATTSYREALLAEPQLGIRVENGEIVCLGVGDSDTHERLIHLIEIATETLQLLRDHDAIVG